MDVYTNCTGLCGEHYGRLQDDTGNYCNRASNVCTLIVTTPALTNMYGNYDYIHEHELRNFRFDPSLPLQLIPPVSSILPSEPTITVTLTRDSELTPSTYIVTPRGVVNSLRRGQKGDLYIGRLLLSEDGNYANDIVLKSTDVQVSRRHCCVFYGQGLGPRGITPEMTAFLMGRHPRVGRSSAVSKLPTDLVAAILAFLPPRRAVFLTDCGSLYGTYVRATAPMPLTPASFVLLSPTVGLHVLSTTWAYAILLNGRWVEVRDGKKSCRGIPEKCKKFPVLWAAVVEGDPTMRMEEKKVVALTPAKGERFELTSRDDTESPLVAVVEYHPNSEWTISEVGRASFGVWLCTSPSRPGDTRYTPRWVEIQSGVQVRVSTTVISIDW